MVRRLKILGAERVSKFFVSQGQRMTTRMFAEHQFVGRHAY